ncbi:MAG: hypothetical protein HYV07_09110 [Deltaproteobacteria bacterium]|nr:hypothetical protein [Deltaproteobacteria bacterium]
MRRLSTSIWAAAAIACDPNVALLRAEGAASTLLVHGETPSIEALAYDSPFYSVPADPRAYALDFACTLDDLGYSAGPLAASPSAAPLPRPPRARQSSGREFVPLDSPPVHAAWRADRRTSDEHCTNFDEKLVPVVGSEEDPIQLVLPLLDGSVLVASESGFWMRLLLDGSLASIPLPRELPHAGGFVRDDGTIWLVGADGSIESGTLELGFHRSGTLTATQTGSRAWVDGSKTGPLELFIVTALGALERFDGEHAALLKEGRPRGPLADSGGAVWLGPGSAIALGTEVDPEGDSPSVGRYSSGEYSALKAPNDELVFSIARHPEAGALVAYRTGGVWQLVDDEFRSVAEPSAQKAFVVSPFGVGFVFGGYNGLLRQSSGGVLCDPWTSEGVRPIVLLLPRAAGLVALSRSDRTNDGSFLALIDPTPDPCAGPLEP